MKHARADYTERIQDSAHKIPEDEPVFLIRAQDQVGAAAVRAWAHLHRVNGGSDPAYEMAMRHADAMEQWPKHKPADLPAPRPEVRGTFVVTDPDPQIDGGLPFTRADQEQLSAIADYNSHNPEDPT